MSQPSPVIDEQPARQPAQLSRRQFLRTGATLAVGLGLAGCPPVPLLRTLRAQL